MKYLQSFEKFAEQDNCKGCGAPLDPKKDKCNYCSAPYLVKKEDENSKKNYWEDYKNKHKKSYTKLSPSSGGLRM